jgi:hypothetical protein
VSLNPLFPIGALVSGVAFVVLVKVWLGMRRKENKQQSLGGFEKPEAEVVSKHEEIAMPEASDYSPAKPEVAAVTDFAEPEAKSTFLAMMTRLVQEKQE